MQTGKRSKIHALDFVRAVCSIGIVLFHLSCYTSSDTPKLLYTYANGAGDFGSLLTGVFFMISGGILYYQYGEISSLRTFYYKRWRSIFPMFYIAYLCCYLPYVLMNRSFFFQGRPWSLLLSVLGMDGYFYYKGFSNYYYVGEWFFGAIIFLYLLYPLFAKLLNKFGAKILLVLLPLWLWQLQTDVFEIDVTCNLIYCSGLFLIGMMIFKYELYRSKIIKWASVPISLVLFLLPAGQFFYIRRVVIILSVTLALFAIGEQIAKIPATRKIFSFLGGLSFPIYLVQNRVGVILVNRLIPKTLGDMVVVSLIAIALCVAAAWLLKAITNKITGTKLFGYIDRFSLQEHQKVEVKNGSA